jgi:3-oxoacyl-[acyl-carrier-protein] synthase II
VPPLRGRRVVVTGLGAVSPNGIGVPAFWEATRSGKSGVSPIVEFDVSDLPIRIAGRVDGFDASRFLPTKELRHVPRVTTLGLAASIEALAGAGLAPERLALEDLRSFAVVVGSGGVGWEFTERQFREYYFGNPKAVSLYTIPASTPGSISSEISMHFGLRGPSHVISTGCTSSSDALGHAFSLIRYGRARWALAGGTDAPISPGIMRGFCLMRILTPSWNDEPERASRPFSRDRDGFVLAEGAWMLVLEELGSALERGATIHAELAGYGATCEAFHRVRLSEDGEEPARAMRLALEDAGLAPENIDYVNFHGTSTELNDRIETRAVKQVFGRRATTILGSSLKSMIGHPQGACGAAGSVASLLAMRDGFAPPTINRDVDDPECDLDVVPHVGRPHEIGALLCNCIGFGSKNAALVFTRVERDGG